MTDPPNQVVHTLDPGHTTLREVAKVFIRLGFTAFGGPAAHVALIEEQVVTRRSWVTREHFLDLVSAVNFIPGPNSTELVIHLGQLRAGLRGLIVAGICFVVPATTIILPLAWAYVKWGTLPRLQSPLQCIHAAVAAVVVVATIRFARTSIKGAFFAALALAAMLIAFILNPQVSTQILGQPVPIQPEIPILILAAIAGWIYTRCHTRHTTFAIFATPPAFWGDLAHLCWEMIKIGGTLFGSGYVLVSYLQTAMVDRHGWLTSQQLADAIAVGQFTPGPLLTTATFVGYVLGAGRFEGGVAGGVFGGIAATIAIFLPSFLLVAVFGPMIHRIRQSPAARGALDAMNAAVVALMVIAAFRLSAPIFQPAGGAGIHWLGLMIFCASLIALWKQVNATWLILLAGTLGWIFPTGT